MVGGDFTSTETSTRPVRQPEASPLSLRNGNGKFNRSDNWRPSDGDNNPHPDLKIGTTTRSVSLLEDMRTASRIVRPPRKRHGDSEVASICPPRPRLPGVVAAGMWRRRRSGSRPVECGRASLPERAAAFRSLGHRNTLASEPMSLRSICSLLGHGRVGMVICCASQGQRSTAPRQGFRYKHGGCPGRNRRLIRGSSR